MYCVYVHINKINNKIYIGQTCQELNKRWRKDGSGYIGCTKFYNAIKKYGWDNFEHIVIRDELTLDEANLLEEYLITQYHSTDDRYGYNIQAGGNNHTIPEETRKQISNTKLSQHLHMSEEQKQWMRKAYSGKGNPFYGKRHSEDTRKKMQKNHADVKGGKNPMAKKVLCIETGQIFLCAGDAAKSINRSKSAITNCCSGRSETSGGYHWKYVEE